MAEAQFIDEKNIQQSSYGIQKDNVLIRSADRPKGKLIYDSEQYHGQNAGMPPPYAASQPEQ